MRARVRGANIVNPDHISRLSDFSTNGTYLIQLLPNPGHARLYTSTTGSIILPGKTCTAAAVDEVFLELQQKKRTNIETTSSSTNVLFGKKILVKDFRGRRFRSRMNIYRLSNEMR